MRFDLLVLGGGPGGYSAAIRAAQLGAKVALVEKEFLGGTCLNRGCIPTKFLASAVSLLEDFRKAPFYGVAVENLKFDLSKLRERKREIVERARRGLENLLSSYDVKVFYGFGKFKSPSMLEVSSRNGGFTLEASKIILASGSRCPDKEKLFPSVSGLLTTDEALELEDLPGSLLVVGGGPAGLELASIYAEIGCEVTVAEMFSQLLPGEDAEIASLLEFSLAQRGLKILTGAKLASLANKNGKVKAVFEDGRAVEAEKVLLAFGRKANVEGLGLEKVGVEVVGGKVQVDAYQQTRVPEIFAVGDVTGGLYAHTALM
ncbi:dihydrolipoyl dehydrogenase, partial [Candidatus Bathyarchaeota archaeon]